MSLSDRIWRSLRRRLRRERALRALVLAADLLVEDLDRLRVRPTKKRWHHVAQRASTLRKRLLRASIASTNRKRWGGETDRLLRSVQSCLGTPPGRGRQSGPRARRRKSLAGREGSVIVSSTMAITLEHLKARTEHAVAHYWSTLSEQRARQGGAHPSDPGGRAAVTGGKQMMGFCRLVEQMLYDNGIPSTDVLTNARLDLPGYFRATKNWDMLVISRGVLVAAIEFKSQAGPSFGNNFNNRCEEAIGTGKDLRVAFREGAFGSNPKPWLGWVMLLENCEKSRAAVDIASPHFPVFPEFKGASYARRYEILLRKLVREELYNAAAFITSPREGNHDGRFEEPADDLNMRGFLAGLIGHALTVQAAR